MMRVRKTAERQVMVVFEPDRLALESLVRAYARLVPVPNRTRRLVPPPRRRLGVRTGRPQEVER